MADRNGRNTSIDFAGNPITRHKAEALRHGATASLVSFTFKVLRQSGVRWEEAAERTASLFHISRSSVGREVKRFEELNMIFEEAECGRVHLDDIAEETARRLSHTGESAEL